MTQKGEHTWDLVIEYLLCPKCERIIENRQSYQYEMGKLIKDVRCEHCGHSFRKEDQRKLEFGPLIGQPQPPEVTWM